MSIRNISFLFFLVFAVWADDKSSRNTECLQEFGCFQSSGIVPVPQSPQTVNTHLNLFTRDSSNTQGTLDVDHYDSQIAGFVAHFDHQKKTKIIIHGYLESGSAAWVIQMKNELLRKGDFNVITVNWSGGSKQEYNHAVANTYLVGSEISYFLKYLHDHQHLTYADVHIIGHSLGAQIAGNVGLRTRTIGRISGLDPAEPDFRGQPVARRLDNTDALFVDVIHTDGSTFNGVSGFGLMDPMGQVDFYPNGGQHQPGCDEHPAGSALNNLLHGGGISGAGNSLTCSHSRSHDYFIESINSNCSFYAHKCSSFSDFDNGKCLDCPASGCPVMGYNADHTPERGSFFLSTSNTAKYCGYEYYVEVKVSHFVLNTYGELLVTLRGTNGHTEELKFSRHNEYYIHDETEHHVIATHSSIGQVSSVKVHFVMPKHDGHTHGVAHNIHVQSVAIRSVVNANSVVKFCGHGATIRDGHSITLTSHQGC